jgi:hypothetical protein
LHRGPSSGCSGASAQAGRSNAERKRSTSGARSCSTFIPAEEKCFCLFEASSAESVQEANERAGLPFERIVEAEFITADELS